ncbi:MAG: LutC/YkgG family protein [Armatimonadota bacterium]
MSRERMLERIRIALRGGAALDEGSGAAGSGAPLDLPVLPPPQVFDDPVALFAERARQVGVTVEIVRSMEEAAMRVVVWCGERAVRRAAVWRTADLASVLARVQAGGVDVLAPDTPLDVLAQADAGITGADWGIAETATLVLATAPAQPRMPSLLPPAHLAILRADQIVADLPALFARPGSMPSALTFITGPSRSADVGLKPVLGAHGPTEVAVMLIQ